MLRFTMPLLLSLVLIAPGIQAQSVYRWVDDEGETHYGQSVPPEFKDYGYVRLGPDGTVRERVEPALSPEEIVERRRQRAARARQEAEAHQQEVRDRMLLATYSSEAALEQSLNMQLAGIESQRTSTRAALKLVENRFASLIARAADLDRDGRPAPDALKTEIDQTRTKLRHLRADLKHLDEREARARERFDANLKRYRELNAADPASG